MEQLNDKNSEQHSNGSLQQSQIFAEELVQMFNEYFAIAGKIEDMYKAIKNTIGQMKKLYKKEKRQLIDYKIFLAEEKVSLSDINDHANDLQSRLDKTSKGFNSLHEDMKDKAKFFSKIKGDGMSYTSKISKSYETFKHIFYDIQDIAFAQEALVKKP